MVVNTTLKSVGTMVEIALTLMRSILLARWTTRSWLVIATVMKVNTILSNVGMMVEIALFPC